MVYNIGYPINFAGAKILLLLAYHQLVLNSEFVLSETSYQNAQINHIKGFSFSNLYEYVMA